ncbi:hypothetical protein WR25_19666 [Diploscapter pachys]|uniref:Uncharacterized protein n=1 Tax=Diploscapter pachys TaxID=2018661 RepID=A0A2A2JVK0_9BILA|nr:hypothetical protein WR25_19666 [Diploscapter pachys]
MSGALRTSESSGSVATTSQGSLAGGLNGGSINGPTSPSTSTSSPTSPQQEGAILTTMIATRNLSSKFTTAIGGVIEVPKTYGVHNLLGRT